MDEVSVLLAERLIELEAAVGVVAKQEGPQGPAGADGKAGRDGIDGADGKDGRDGIDGADGKDGRDGIDGADGKDGRDGTDGKDGALGPMPKHRWEGTRLRFEKPDGKWGEAVDLLGPRGSPGSRGRDGVGTGATSPAILTDYTGPRYQFLGYATRIVRLDHATAPAVAAECATDDLQADWPGRVGLEYV